MSSTPAQRITEADVRREAKMSRIEIPDDRVEELRRDLEAVLEYVELLRELDLKNVDPMTHPHDGRARLEPDEPGATLPRDALLRMAPRTEGPFVEIPKVIGGDGGT